MPDTIRSMCKLFADDSKLYLTIKSRNDQEIIQSDLFKLCDWSKEWLMPFNIAKCKAIDQSNVIVFIRAYWPRDNNFDHVTFYCGGQKTFRSMQCPLSWANIFVKKIIFNDILALGFDLNM